MRITSGYDLLALATEAHDHIYPSKSPTCEGKLVGCADPQPSCRFYEYCWQRSGKTYCRAPALHVPQECEGDDCPHRLYDRNPSGKPGTIKHATNHKTGTSRVPQHAMRVTKHSLRKHRDRQRKRTWVLAWLSAHLDDRRCRIIFYDLDESMTREEYDDLAERVFRDFTA